MGDMKHFLLSPIFLVAFCLMTTCASAEEIKVGWIGPLSGDAASLGVDSVEVARQVFEEINRTGGIHGTSIKLIAEDDRYETARTVSAYRKLVDYDKVKVIFVLTYGGMLALAEQAQKDNVVLIDTLDCDAELAALPKNIFCVTKRTEDLAMRAASHAVGKKLRSAAILYYDGDPFMPKVAKVTKQTLEQNGVEVAVFDGISGPTKDLRTTVLRAKQKNAEAIFFYGYDDIGLGMKQARELGITAPFYALGVVNSPGFRSSAGDALNGTYIAGWFAPESPAYTAFLTQYKEKMGRTPLLEIVTIPTYDVARILTQGFERITSKDSATLDVEKLRDYLYSVKGFQGLSGTISIDPDGTSQSFTVKMYRFDDGNFTLVE